MRTLKYADWLVENTSSLTPEQEEFLNKFTTGKWRFVPSTGLVDIEGDFYCSNERLTDFQGVKFGKISGTFNCTHNLLTSLDGGPQEVGQHFFLGFNLLTSLQGSPRVVGGDFWCHDNQLTSLVGAPKEVQGFGCYKNKLQTLEGAPKKIGGGIWCAFNKLTSLKGSPREVGGGFWCGHNDLTTLEGAPESVGGDFWCLHNPLNSLKGAPLEIANKFSCDAFRLPNKGWTVAGLFKKLQKGNRKPIANDMLQGLLTKDFMNKKIQKNPILEMTAMKGIWNDPEFQKIKKDLKFPSKFGDVGQTISALNKADSMKGFF